MARDGPPDKDNDNHHSTRAHTHTYTYIMGWWKNACLDMWFCVVVTLRRYVPMWTQLRWFVSCQSRWYRRCLPPTWTVSTRPSLCSKLDTCLSAMGHCPSTLDCSLTAITTTRIWLAALVSTGRWCSLLGQTFSCRWMHSLYLEETRAYNTLKSVHTDIFSMHKTHTRTYLRVCNKICLQYFRWMLVLTTDTTTSDSEHTNSQFTFFAALDSIFQFQFETLLLKLLVFVPIRILISPSTACDF